MVKGIEKFREYFRGHEREFVLIGGAACDEWFGARNLRFRATKDLDVVLVVETLTQSFLRRFWKFIQAGKYQSQERADGSHEYFRFLKPEKADYPAQIELFSRHPDGFQLFAGQEIIQIHAGENISSLSAILMNEDYYRLILGTREVRNDLPMVGVNGLIPLKTRAWLDLTQRKQTGAKVDTDDISKHRNDVFRLALTLTVGGRFDLPESIRADLRQFLETFSSDLPDWQDILNAIRITIRRPPDPESIRKILINYFAL